MDLRELLQIEMEWLGEESANLAHAGDEKLRTYSMMLKEQIHEIVQQTFQIPYESQYEPLRSFITPFQTRMPNWDQVSREMEELIHQLQCRINDLNNPKLFRESMRRMENQHDMDSDYFDCPF